MPDIIDPDVNDDERRFTGQDIFFQTSLQIRNFIAADPGTDHFQFQVGMLLSQCLADQTDIALVVAVATLRNRIAQENDSITLLQSDPGFVRQANLRDQTEHRCCH